MLWQGLIRVRVLLSAAGAGTVAGADSVAAPDAGAVSAAGAGSAPAPVAATATATGERVVAYTNASDTGELSSFARRKTSKATAMMLKRDRESLRTVAALHIRIRNHSLSMLPLH